MVGSWTDWDLSELGIEQAERIGQKLAKQLSGHKIVMYASDLLRAKHTAEIVAKHMGITPNIRTELRERNLGKCVGKSVQWLRENIEVQEKTIDDRMFSDAESRRDEWNRLKPLFDEIMASNDECIIVVSHGDLLSVWNTMFLGMDVETLNQFELFGMAGRVNRTYDIFNEDARLNHSKAARVEFLTTVHYIEKYLKDGDKILDIGAGAGEYSLYFARKGYEVSALELADANIAAFKKKLTPEDKIDLVQGNALDLSRYADKSFDIVLLFGPLYHLKNDADKQKCISEAKRVCKDGGKIFFAFISNDFVFLTEFGYDVNYFSNGDYDKETFKLNDFPFVFHTVGAARKLLADGGINILHEVASDGASELLAARINEMSDEDYTQYLRYHFYICEKPELLGMTNHLLFMGEKK